jgi:hypothetical protein
MKRHTPRDPIFATIAAHQKAAAALMVALKHKWRLEDKLGDKAYDGDDPKWIAAEKAEDAAWRGAMRRRFASFASSRRRPTARLRCSTISLTSAPTACRLLQSSSGKARRAVRLHCRPQRRAGAACDGGAIARRVGRA